MHRVRTIVVLCVILAVLTVVSVVPCVAVAGSSAARGECWTPGLSRIATDGIGDSPDSWQNSYPWSMSMFQGDLYIGTGRVGCTSSVMSLMSGPMAGGAGVQLPGGSISGNTPQAPTSPTTPPSTSARAPRSGACTAANGRASGRRR
jgi:hypothetical protein